MLDEALLETLGAKLYIENAIDQAIDNSFVVTSNRLDRIKRHKVYKAVSERLNLNLNNELCVLIKDRLQAKGVKAAILEGNLCFKNISVKVQGM